MLIHYHKINAEKDVSYRIYIYIYIYSYIYIIFARHLFIYSFYKENGDLIYWPFWIERKKKILWKYVLKLLWENFISKRKKEKKKNRGNQRYMTYMHEK